MSQYILGPSCWKAALWKKPLSVLVDLQLSMNQQCTLGAKEVSSSSSLAVLRCPTVALGFISPRGSASELAGQVLLRSEWRVVTTGRGVVPVTSCGLICHIPR